MRKLLFLLTLVTLLIFSCRKDYPRKDKSISYIINTPEHCNNVFYKNFVPDTIIHPLLYDTISYFLDVNNDSINDIRFYILHYYQYYGPHPYDAYSVTATGVDSIQFVKKTHYTPCDVSLDSAIYIGDTCQLLHNMALEIVQPLNMINCNTFTQGGYLGFQITKKGIPYYGWIKIKIYDAELTLYDYAVCNCPGHSIQAGYH